MFADISGKIVG